MHIAILVTNTDDSAFAGRHPRDGEKFRALLAPLRPDWKFAGYPVRDGVFPADLQGIDGVIITGSPASINDDFDWIDRLLALIPQIVAARIPLFGACLGHQAIALALGGSIAGNPGPFVFGTVETEVLHQASFMRRGPARVRQYAAHGEQVVGLPDGATVLTRGPEGAIGGFAIGDRVFTTQYHPEMTPEFIAALIEELSDRLDPKVIAAAKTSLKDPADRQVLGRWIARFFDQARLPGVAG